MKKINIIIVNDFNFVNGGAAKIALSTAKMLPKEKYNVILFSSVSQNKNNDNLETEIKNINIDQKELINGSKLLGSIRGLWNFKAMKAFDSLLSTLSPENTIIHFHGWLKSLSPSLFFITWKRKMKLVITLHDYFVICPNGGLYNYKMNRICNVNPLSASCILSDCDSRNYIYKIWRIARQFIQNKLIYMNKNRLNLIYVSKFSHVVFKKYLKNIKAKAYYLPNFTNTPNIGRAKVENNENYIFVGRLSKEKGVSIFCKVIYDLKLKGIILGDGYLKNDIIEKYPNIILKGWLSEEEVLENLKFSKALVFPSLLYETAGLVVLEALSLGVPCIVPRSSASSEYIRDGFNGYTYIQGNINSLKEKLVLLGDNSEVKKLSINAYNSYWNSPYSIDRYIYRLDRIYSKILGGK